MAPKAAPKPAAAGKKAAAPPATKETDVKKAAAPPAKPAPSSKNSLPAAAAPDQGKKAPMKDQSAEVAQEKEVKEEVAPSAKPEGEKESDSVNENTKDGAKDAPATPPTPKVAASKTAPAPKASAVKKTPAPPAKVGDAKNAKTASKAPAAKPAGKPAAKPAAATTKPVEKKKVESEEEVKTEEASPNKKENVDGGAPATTEQDDKNEGAEVSDSAPKATPPPEAENKEPKTPPKSTAKAPAAESKQPAKTAAKAPPVAKAPAKEPPAKASPREAPAKAATPAKAAPAKGAPSKEAPAKTAPAKAAPAKEAPSKAAPAKAAAGKKAKAVLAPSPPKEPKATRPAPKAKEEGKKEEPAAAKAEKKPKAEAATTEVGDSKAEERKRGTPEHGFKEHTDETKKNKADAAKKDDPLVTGPVLCGNCIELISDETYAKNKDGVCLHSRCVEAWKYKAQHHEGLGGHGAGGNANPREKIEPKPPIGECTQCKKPIPSGVAYMKGKDNVEEASKKAVGGDGSGAAAPPAAPLLLHEKCVEAWKAATQPVNLECAQCKKPIGSGAEYVKLTNPFGEEFVLHKGECKTEYELAVAPTCKSCKKPITEDGVTIDGEPFHQKCQKDWDGTAAKCGQCGEVIEGAYLQLTKGDVKIPCHEACADAWRKDNAKTCKKCAELILDVNSSKLGDDFYHTKCAEEVSAEKDKTESVGECAQCKLPITRESTHGGGYLKAGEGIVIHADCKEAYQDATAPKCGYCKENIVGAYVTTSVGEGEAKETVSYHEACADKKKGEDALEAAKAKDAAADAGKNGEEKPAE